jgi:hypothetical protein
VAIFLVLCILYRIGFNRLVVTDEGTLGEKPRIVVVEGEGIWMDAPKL